MSIYLGTTPLADGASTALLSEKADVDLSNTLQSGINAVMEWTAPDWSSIVTITSPYKAPSDGWIIWNAYVGATGVASAELNGSTVFYVGGSNVSYNPVFFRVSAGDIFTYTVSVSNSSYFIPCKGAN